MGKGKKIKSSSGDNYIGSSVPLDKLIERSNIVKKRILPRNIHSNDVDKIQFLSGNLTTKILNEARQQNRENVRYKTDEANLVCAAIDSSSISQIHLESVDLDAEEYPNNEADWGQLDCPVFDINAEDETAMQKFMSMDNIKQKTLCDLMEIKVNHKRMEIASEFPADITSNEFTSSLLQPEIKALYQDVGAALAKYRSGKIPKAFKIVPKLRNWEQILSLTKPDNWSAAATYQATRLFASNLNARMSQRFYNLILLPRIRDEVEENKKLCFHLYQALIKSLYRPAAFFKGILLPLCQSGTCTLREATIIGSVLTRCSVPMMHSAAALLKIAEMDYSGANSLFIRILIDKKYTLPYRVIDGLVYHFLKFATDDREMHVLWHQALLALCQRYKTDISIEQKEALLGLLKSHYHYQISMEIKRELHMAASRDEDSEENVTKNYMEID